MTIACGESATASVHSTVPSNCACISVVFENAAQVSDPRRHFCILARLFRSWQQGASASREVVARASAPAPPCLWPPHVQSRCPRCSRKRTRLLVLWRQTQARTCLSSGISQPRTTPRAAASRPGLTPQHSRTPPRRSSPSSVGRMCGEIKGPTSFGTRQRSPRAQMSAVRGECHSARVAALQRCLRARVRRAAAWASCSLRSRAALVASRRCRACRRAQRLGVATACRRMRRTRRCLS